MTASERFTPSAIQTLREAIADALGNEVFAAGSLDEEGLVAELTVAARGRKDEVLALASYQDRGDVIIHNHPSGILEPSQADLAVASSVGDRGVGSYIVDNGVENVYVIAEPARRRALVALDEDEIAGVLEPGGKLSKRIPSYEPRESQIALTRHIARAFNEGLVLAAEAGTGVGKSFAYLLPAFAWAARNGERVVVSTATINLQRQLMDKDIPVVAGLFRKKLKAVLAKGRGNYLCRNRLLEALDEEGLLAGDDHPLRRIAAWAEETATGDRADLSFWPDDETWARVRSESDSCLGLRCARRSECFVLRAKREAADANVIVVNHHLLFADLAARLDGAGYETAAVLPPFQALIFDEAHAMESSAVSYFSEELTRFSVLRALGRLFRTKRERRFGVLVRMQNLKGLPADLFAKVPDRIAAVRAAADDLDSKVVALLAAEPSVRVRKRSPELEDGLFAPLSALEKSLVALAQLLKDLFDPLPDEVLEDPSVYEAKLSLKRLSEMASVCAKFREAEEYPESVIWVSRERTSRLEAFAKFTVTPLDLSGMMNEAVFLPYRSVVCTSATLAVNGSFDYWRRRVGLSHTDAEVETAVYPSPFPYERNALVVVPTDAPNPTDGAWQGFVDRAVLHLLEASGGHALVLFTSYESLKSAYEAALPRLQELGITAFRQGQDERGRLLEAFKADAASVLFATDSFWEGVDAPGDTLWMVVMAKLPFRVPTDPVQKARAEAIERRDGNPFMELSLPEAVLRFKQGFGRLIRHSEDRGVVAVLDSRIVHKRYGKIFLDSLPRCRVETGNLERICSEVSVFRRQETEGGRDAR